MQGFAANFPGEAGLRHVVGAQKLLEVEAVELPQRVAEGVLGEDHPADLIVRHRQAEVLRLLIQETSGHQLTEHQFGQAQVAQHLGRQAAAEILLQLAVLAAKTAAELDLGDLLVADLGDHVAVVARAEGVADAPDGKAEDEQGEEYADEGLDDDSTKLVHPARLVDLRFTAEKAPAS